MTRNDHVEKKMNNGLEATAAQPRSIGRSIVAVLAGFVAVAVLSLGTDLGLHAVGLWPSLGQSMSGPLLLVATGSESDRLTSSDGSAPNYPAVLPRKSRTHSAVARRPPKG